MKQAFILFFIITTLSCAKENIGVPSTPLIPFGTIVKKSEGEVRPEVVSTLEMNRYLIRVTDSTVVYAINTPEKERLTAGGIIIGNPDKHSQYGFLRRIVSRTDNEYEVILSASNASLGDAFKNLNIDVLYNNNGETLLRDPNALTLTEFPPILIPLGAGGNGAAITTPRFGYTGGLAFRVVSNKQTEEIEEIIFGLENFAYELQLNTRLELVASTDKISKEFILPVNFPMAIPIGPYVITIVTTIKFTPTIEPSARGILAFKQTIKPSPFTMLMKIKPYELLLSDAFTVDISNNIPPAFDDLGYDFEITDLSGEMASEYKMPITLEFSPLGFSKFASAGVEIDPISYTFSAKTETDNGTLQARVNTSFGSSAKFFVNSDFIDKLLNGAEGEGVIEFLPPYELEVYDVPLFEKEEIYIFPCSKNYTLVRVESECVGDEIQFKFRINTASPGNTGYKVTLGNEDIGIYPYNQLHTFSKPANQVPNVQDFIFKDEEAFGCLVKRTVINKCLVTVACEPNSEFTDARDGEKYCYVTVGGYKVLSKNLNYSGAGVCYDNSSDNCLLQGRLYSFEEAKTACPAGWKIPTVDEYRAILAEDYSNSLSPIVGGSTTSGNGLNFLPGGEYHPWAVNTEQFAGGFFDTDPQKKYLYWTADERIENTSVNPGNPGVAFDVWGKIPVLTPQKTGYPCRCIKQ
jgi:uncharacterized protein (TIGR02145 family)